VLKKLHRSGIIKVIRFSGPIRDFNRVPMPTPFFHAACAALCLALLAACGEHGARGGSLQAGGGDPAAGKRLVTQHQCGACHAIPGVQGAGGDAGPSLEGFGRMSYIAGRIPNQPRQLAAWLIDPPAMKPGTAMPALGLTEQEARHMAAFLATLR
jgi:cytochrome c2